jgi:hypothetical protein
VNNIVFIFYISIGLTVTELAGIRIKFNRISEAFFYYLVCEAIGTAASPDLLCQPRVIVKMIVEKQVECRLAGETKVFGENLPQRHFRLSQNPT